MNEYYDLRFIILPHSKRSRTLFDVAVYQGRGLDLEMYDDTIKTYIHFPRYKVIIKKVTQDQAREAIRYYKANDVVPPLEV